MIYKVCSVCGSDKVSIIKYVIWHVLKQKWIIETHNESDKEDPLTAYCYECDLPTNIKDVDELLSP